MAVSSDLIRASIVQVASVEGVAMSYEALVEDIALLAKAWPDEQDFAAAVASSVCALDHVAKGKVTPDPLKDDLEGWWSHHCQLRRAQGEPAALRVVFRRIDSHVEVKGFGHRFKPASIYHRLAIASENRG